MSELLLLVTSKSESFFPGFVSKRGIYDSGTWIKFMFIHYQQQQEQLKGKLQHEATDALF